MPNMDIRRGDIRLIRNRKAVGHEIKKDRPGVVVTADALNLINNCVTVVYLTGSRDADLPFRVTIKSARNAGHEQSTALCDQIYTVDKSRVGRKIAVCTAAEMKSIEGALQLATGIIGKIKLPKRGKRT